MQTDRFITICRLRNKWRSAPNLWMALRVLKLFVVKIKYRSYLHSFPSVLLSSALCRCGYWSANFLRAAWAQTMKAFIGLLICGFRFSLPLVRDGIGTRVQSYPFNTCDTASWIWGGNFSFSMSSLLSTLSSMSWRPIGSGEDWSQGELASLSLIVPWPLREIHG